MTSVTTVRRCNVTGGFTSNARQGVVMTRVASAQNLCMIRRAGDCPRRCRMATLAQIRRINMHCWFTSDIDIVMALVTSRDYSRVNENDIIPGARRYMTRITFGNRFDMQHMFTWC